MLVHQASSDRRSFNRRTFLQTGAALACAPLLVQAGQPQPPVNPLAQQVGVTISTFSAQLGGKAKGRNFTLLELPQILRDELDMRVIDLNTTYFESFDSMYLDRLQQAADKAGCVLTNLKLNQSHLNIGSPDRAEREMALAEYKRSIDVAERLKLNWVRPIPRKEQPNLNDIVTGYQELAEYGSQRNVELLVENFGWLDSDPEATAKLVKAVGKNVAACPDTGNWRDNNVRYAGLEKTFPLAATCDFKVFDLGVAGEHKAYDLKRCFAIGWESGFRGPWCLEHPNVDTEKLFAELAFLRDSLRQWMGA